MHDTIVIYVKNKSAKAIVEKAADKKNMSLSKFVWKAICSALEEDSQVRIRKLEIEANQ